MCEHFGNGYCLCTTSLKICELNENEQLDCEDYVEEVNLDNIATTIKRDKLQQLVNNSDFCTSDERTILEACGFDVTKISYLQVFSNGDYVGDTYDDNVSELINFEDYTDEQIDEIFECLTTEFEDELLNKETK